MIEGRIHDLVRVRVSEDSTWAREYLEQMGDVLHWGTDTAGQPVTVEIGATALGNGAEFRELEADVRIARHQFLDEAYGVGVDSLGPDVFRLQSNQPALEWLSWMVHLAVLSAGGVLVHGAAVEKDGSAVLFPSWGGVGKTALVTRFVREWGWRFLGDDFSIVKSDGTCLGFPKPMVLYPYHRPLFPEVFSTGNGPIAPAGMTRMLSTVAIAAKPVLRRIPTALALARKYNPQSVRVKPSSVFGIERLAGSAKVGGVVWLDRVAGVKTAELVAESPDIISRIVGSTINEYDGRCVRLTHTAMGLGMMNVQDLYERSTDILATGFAGVPHRLLYIPADLPVDRVPDVVSDVLSGSGIAGF